MSSTTWRFSGCTRTRVGLDPRFTRACRSLIHRMYHVLLMLYPRATRNIRQVLRIIFVVFIYPVPYLYIRSSIYISVADPVPYLYIRNSIYNIRYHIYISVAVFINPVPYSYIRSSIYYIISLAVFIYP